MKTKILLLSIIQVLVFSVLAQNDSVPSSDTAKIILKNKTIIIISKNSNTPTSDTLTLSESDTSYTDDDDDESKWEFKTLYNFGWGGYLTTDNQIELPAQYQDFEIDYGKSRSFGFDFMLKGADILNRRVYISPGLGFTWNKYRFKDKQLTLSTQNDTVVFIKDSTFTYDSYKLRTAYIEVPLMLGFRLGNLDKKYFTINVGAVGGYNIGNVTKSKYAIAGTKHRKKIKDDYNVQPFKLDAIARVSFGKIGIFGRYSFTSLFEKNKAPELIPFSLGISWGRI